jgi:hypothetical protein
MSYLIKFLTKLNKLIVIILCLSLLIFPVKVSSDSSHKDKYTFEYYTNYLSLTLFPEIKTYLQSHKKYLNSEAAQKMSREVVCLIIDNLKENHIPISKSPKVKIFRLENDKNVAFLLQVELNFLDEEESVKNLFITSNINKVFIIFLSAKKSGVKV